MKPFLLPIIALSSISSLLADQGGIDEGLIVFANGDRIAGNLLEKINGETSPKVKIGSPYFKDYAIVATQNLNYIAWNRERKSHDGSAIVKLYNGDIVHGKIIELGERSINLSSIWSETVSIDRRLIESIKFINLGKIIYEGTASLDGWTLSNKNIWSVQNGAFVTSESGARISRDVKLPSKIRISTQFQSRNYTQAEMKLWTADVNTTGASFVNITFRGNTIKIDKYENGMFSSLVSATKNNDRENFRFDLFADRDSDQYLIYVDGEKLNLQDLKENEDDENILAADAEVEPEQSEDSKKDAPEKEAPNFGGTIVLNLLSSGMGLKDLCISEWDGVSPGGQLSDYEAEVKPQKEGETSKKMKEPALKTGRVLLNNGDRLEGKITQEGELIVVASALYTVKVPFGVISMLNIPPPPVNPFEPAESSDNPLETPPGGLMVKVDLSDGSLITAWLDSVRDDGMSFASPYTEGELALPLELVKKIEFLKIAENSSPDLSGPRTTGLIKS